MRLIVALVLFTTLAGPATSHKAHHKQVQWQYDDGVLVLHSGNFDSAI